jgi:hypothetical protein
MNSLSVLIGLLCLSLSSIPASAAEQMPLACIGYASSQYGIPPRLLYALYLTEHGRIGKASVNSNGSMDIGPFQLNTLWIKEIKPYGIDERHVAWIPSVSAMIAAWRLKSEIILANYNVWEGVGNYRSRTRIYHDEEINRVVRNYLSIPPSTNYSGAC